MSYVLRDVICTNCNNCRDLDLCRDPHLQVSRLTATLFHPTMSQLCLTASQWFMRLCLSELLCPVALQREAFVGLYISTPSLFLWQCVLFCSVEYLGPDLYSELELTPAVCMFVIW